MFQFFKFRAAFRWLDVHQVHNNYKKIYIYKIFVRTEFDVFGKYSTGDEIEVAKPTPVIQNFNNHLSEYTNGSSLDYVYL